MNQHPHPSKPTSHPTLANQRTWCWNRWCGFRKEHRWSIGKGQHILKEIVGFISEICWVEIVDIPSQLFMCHSMENYNPLLNGSHQPLVSSYMSQRLPPQSFFWSKLCPKILGPKFWGIIRFVLFQFQGTQNGRKHNKHGRKKNARRIQNWFGLWWSSREDREGNTISWQHV